MASLRHTPESPSSAKDAYLDAARDALEQAAEPVPLHLRNAPTKLMKALDYGKGVAHLLDRGNPIPLFYALQCQITYP